jgi:Fe-S-cluster containining protein
MIFQSSLVDLHDDKLDEFFNRLQAVFAQMDRKYDEIAASYGFECRGCEDNCCQTRFYHHTYLEYLFVGLGFDKLDAAERSIILNRAVDVCRQAELADQKGAPVRSMCPLNLNGMCSIYDFRPMICRMHGIPHELRKPGQSAVRGPGCGDFDLQCPDASYVPFDRTPFYFEMAKLENEFKAAAGISGRIKLTIAEMLLE